VTEIARSLWNRATEALRAAEVVLSASPDAAASRAYYAAFYAVSAIFARDGKKYRRHSAVEIAVHRDLVKTGTWPANLGEAYSNLFELRSLSDYGEAEHATPEEAKQAIKAAADILHAVAKAHPADFPLADNG
jgi:hypothetical protein